MIMGLSSKQVFGDRFDWPQGVVKSGGVEISAQPARPQQQKQRQQQASQQQQQQGPQMRCPRCDSTNTKFCYYNNYSRAQPRHFCKACRRHWTAGGTLRNVPVGGGRKTKRPKTSHPASSAADPAAVAVADDTNAIMPASIQLLPALSFARDVLPPAFLPASLPPSAYANTSYELGSLLSLPSTPHLAGAAGALLDDGGSYPFSTSATFPSFSSLTGQEDLAAGISSDTAITPLSMATPSPWELLPPPATCSGGPSGSSVTTTSSDLTALESSSAPSSSYWGSCWEDLTSLISIDLEQYPPAADAPPLHQYFNLS